jgi:hypothetical protein
VARAATRRLAQYGRSAEVMQIVSNPSGCEAAGEGWPRQQGGLRDGGLGLGGFTGCDCYLRWEHLAGGQAPARQLRLPHLGRDEPPDRRQDPT